MLFGSGLFQSSWPGTAKVLDPVRLKIKEIRSLYFQLLWLLITLPLILGHLKIAVYEDSKKKKSHKRDNNEPKGKRMIKDGED